MRLLFATLRFVPPPNTTARPSVQDVSPFLVVSDGPGLVRLLVRIAGARADVLKSLKQAARLARAQIVVDQLGYPEGGARTPA